MNPFLAADGYKLFHHSMSPEGTSMISSNLTPRSNKHAPLECKRVLVVGNQLTMMKIVRMFEKGFFQKNKRRVMKKIKKEFDLYSNTDFDVSHIAALHDLGYLPIHVKGIPEGLFVDMGVPVFTIKNTNPKFPWVTNFLETMISNMIWKPMTSATLGYAFKELNDKWIRKTDSGNEFHSHYGCHDFSMRGLDSLFAAMTSGIGHLISHYGTDSLPTLHAVRKYYGDKGFIAGSIPATEHSIQCAYYKDGSDYDYVKEIITRFPNGPVGVVSDGFNLWNLLTVDVPRLKDQIMSRTGGPVVFRPDSGNPVDIVCGKNTRNNFISLTDEDQSELVDCYDGDFEFWLKDGDLPSFSSKEDDPIVEVYDLGELGFKKVTFSVGDCIESSWEGNVFEANLIVEDYVNGVLPEDKGVIEILWEIFGGTINSQGYKVLHPSVRMIYGDAINLDRFNEINTKLSKKGFASTNWIAGIGSFTYQFNTRDTFGFAIKSTYQEITSSYVGPNGNIISSTIGKDIYKDPITDDGTKTSAKGMLKVINSRPDAEEDQILFDGKDNFVLVDQVTKEEEEGGCLQTIFLNNVFHNKVKLNTIRKRAQAYSDPV